ncbi:MAG: hypothetical protein O7F74_08575 [Bacteroidetes bacterium]|nr:hypothetical protein [Bacteroidota bacterium]
MSKSATISARTLTLIIGIIVAIFIAISSIIISNRNQETSEQKGEELTSSNLTVYLNRAEKNVKSLIFILKKMK